MLEIGNAIIGVEFIFWGITLTALVLGTITYELYNLWKEKKVEESE